MTKFLPLAALALCATTGAFAQTAETPAVDPAIYPAPAAGEQRVILPLAPAENEDLLKVEIFAGKTLKVDCNRVMIHAPLEQGTVEGWGYGFTRIGALSPAASTMMGCPDGTKTETLVQLTLGEGEGVFQRYNSKLPLVIYAPEGLTIGYRIWQTDGALHQE